MVGTHAGFYRRSISLSTASLKDHTCERAPNTYGEYPRTFNIEHGLEVQHELLPRLSLTGGWFHGALHNLTTTLNVQLARRSIGVDRRPLASGVSHSPQDFDVFAIGRCVMVGPIDLVALCLVRLGHIA